MAKSKKNKNRENTQTEIFLKNCFGRYLLRYDWFFYTLNNKGETKPLPLFKNGVVSEKILERSAEMLGMDTSDILARNEDAAKLWYKKYPFFAHLGNFESRRCRSYYGEGFIEALFIKAIFREKAIGDLPERYDRESLQARMIETLKQADKFLPGTYHEGADILDFDYDTAQFFSYPRIGEMISSFMDMVARARELFFKCWDAPLTEEEIKEYNFLVTGLKITENIIPRLVYYKNLQKLIPIYRSEGYKGEEEEFFDLVHLRFCYQFAPWSCKEFAENAELAQLYATVYPGAKRAMFDFGKRSESFNCHFKWSDEKPYVDIMDQCDELLATGKSHEEINEFYDEEFERELADLDVYDKIGIGNIAGWTRVRIPKTAEEMNGDETYSEKLIRLGGVVAKGGIRVPKRKVCDGLEKMSRMIARINIWRKESYE